MGQHIQFSLEVTEKNRYALVIKRSWESHGKACSMLLQTLGLIRCLRKVPELSFSTGSFVLLDFVFTKLFT